MVIGESERYMLTINGVQKAYTPGVPVLQNVSLTVDRGEIVCLLGPSGCGKSTLLRIVAGLEPLTAGELLLDGQDLTTMPVHRRNFGLMFQSFALFPHRTVAENIAFGLQMAGQTKATIQQRVAEVLALVDLNGYGERSIFDLSGGEQQRVALARSLAPNPRLLMLDEPLGSLDRTLRDELVTELRKILTQVNATALYVTHDQQEAFAIADRLVVMRAGHIEQIGTPYQVYHQPANAFVARFLGLSNVAPVTMLPGSPAKLQTPWSEWPSPDGLQADAASSMHQLLIRPDGVQAIALTLPSQEQQRAGHSWWLTGQLALLSFRGATYRLELAISSTTNEAFYFGFDVPTALVAPHLSALTIGASVCLRIDPQALTLVG